nr:MAG TPA: hypothetical protein [Caudoviricetes sp.]
MYIVYVILYLLNELNKIHSCVGTKEVDRKSNN